MTTERTAHRQTLVDAAYGHAFNFVGDSPITEDGQSDPRWECVAYEMQDWEIDLVIGKVRTVKTAIAAITAYIETFAR